MGFFIHKKKPAPNQPRADWPWSLNVGGELYPKLGAWEMVVSQLRELNLEDPDSFLILEQADPKNPKNIWFIQSAINRAGPHPGWYTVEVGWGGDQGRGLLDLQVQTAEEVIPFFRAAFDRKTLDLSRFQDMSHMLG